ncbi:response regulator [Bacillus infantis]|uniref:Response regulator n=1 Tax=Bacillus infantis TaxID=324767 RepID=A0A5D4QU60_9BACI|nr:response regulator [Bacillus infantis]TYS40772.1 response regulator [Bacillus infantis]
MYKVLIIDDEPMITKGLSEKIDWASLDCMIEGVAANGLEGKKMIDELRPDIIVSDIVMPGCTGLELASYVHQHHKNTIMILLSGHDEFTFAKEALKYSVFDYLLKPTIKEEVMNVIRNVVKNIEEKREQDKNYQYLESALQENIPLIEQSLLYDITVKGTVHSKDLRDKIESFRLTFGKGAVLTIEVDDHEENQILSQSIIKSVEGLLNKNNITARYVANDNQIIVLPTFPIGVPSKVLGTRMIDAADRILDHLMLAEKLSVSIGVGGIYSSVNSLHSSYLQSAEALERSYFAGKGIVHIFDDQKQRHSEDKNTNSLESFIQSFEERSLERILEEYELLFKELKYTYDKQFILNQCLELLIKLGLLVSKWDKHFKISVGYGQLEKCTSIDELQDFMKKVIIQIKDHLYEEMSENNIGIVEQAKKIIEQQYDNPDLSAQYMADKLDVNVSYLSRTFKKETGENLINFVTEKRMQMAQKLLDTTDLKTNEVAKRVGFIDARYFGQVFKKFMSTTPSQYKKSK